MSDSDDAPSVIEGIQTLFGIRDILSAGNSFRESAITDEVKGYTIDTACPPDTNKWETGIKSPDSGKWVIVEKYDSKTEAKVGHKKWCASVKGGQTKFKRINPYQD